MTESELTKSKSIHYSYSLLQFYSHSFMGIVVSSTLHRHELSAVPSKDFLCQSSQLLLVEYHHELNRSWILESTHVWNQVLHCNEKEVYSQVLQALNFLNIVSFFEKVLLSSVISYPFIHEWVIEQETLVLKMDSSSSMRTQVADNMDSINYWTKLTRNSQLYQ